MAVANLHSGLQPVRYVSRIWRTQDGLPENRIRAIAQTPDGYLWLGTSSGLARFDGVRFVVYARFNTPSMKDDSVHALAVARDGALWVATDGGGLLRYHDGRFQCFGANEGLTNDFVAAVLEDSRGDVWAATNRGLFRRAGGKFQRLDEELHLANIAFFGLCERRDGRVFAGGPAGLFVAENGRLLPYGTANEAAEVYHVAAAQDASIWLATNHGLRISESAPRHSKRPHLASSLGAISPDHAGNMWIGTEGDGLFLVRAGQERAFRLPVSLPDNSISAILEDREGSIWVGTADGLAQLSVPEIDVLNTRQGLSDDNVSTVYSDRRGTIWLTTVTGRIYQYARGQVKAVRLPPPANDLPIRGIFEDHAGALWFGTASAGIVRLSNGKASRFTMKDGLRNNGFQVFFEDRRNQLWIGTTSGISRWDGSRLTNYYLESGLSYGWIRAIAEDRNGDLLVGTDRGLNRFHNGRFVQDPISSQLSRDRVWSIFRDAKETVWIATPGAGLVRVRDGKVSRITTREGLSANSIFQVIGDGGGRLWMSGPLGLSSASLADLNSVADGRLASVSVLSYGIGAGLESTQMNGGVQPSGIVAPDGELWFPSIKGAVHFKPRFSAIRSLSPVRVESVRVDDQFVPPNHEVVIGPGRRRIEFEFTACNLRDPERVNFRYRLEGFETHWIASAGHRAALYDHLPPGRYRFQVIARDGAMVDASTEAAVSLLVEPHFYQTSWFYALALAAAGFCAAGVFLFQEKQVRDRYNLRLEERTRIAREMHDTVVQGCIGVSTLIEAAVGSARSDQDQMLESLDNARIYLRMTLDEARQALSDLRHDSFQGGLSSALFDLAQASAAERGIPVKLQVIGSARTLTDPVNRALLLIAREAIRNAILHGAANAVSIVLAFHVSAISLAVGDDGCGFEAASPERLAAAGHFGILGMRERMEQIGGSLQIASSPAMGTKVTAHLPFGVPGGV